MTNQELALTLNDRNIEGWKEAFRRYKSYDPKYRGRLSCPGCRKHVLAWLTK